MVIKATPGSALIVYINSRPFGAATSIDWSVDVGRRAIYGLDQITPVELAPGPVKTTGRIECFRVRLDGGLEGRGFLAATQNLLSEKYIHIMVIDRLTDSVVFEAIDAAVNNQNWRAETKGILRGGFAFESITNANEASKQ